MIAKYALLSCSAQVKLAEVLAWCNTNHWFQESDMIISKVKKLSDGLKLVTAEDEWLLYHGFSPEEFRFATTTCQAADVQRMLLNYCFSHSLSRRLTYDN